jgi:hypothetical protein
MFFQYARKKSGKVTREGVEECRFLDNPGILVNFDLKYVSLSGN